MGEAPVGDLAP